ncbi:2036_t:CDS:2, partial [Gigaspora rosea]
TPNICIKKNNKIRKEARSNSVQAELYISKTNKVLNESKNLLEFENILEPESLEEFEGLVEPESPVESKSSIEPKRSMELESSVEPE